MAENLSIAWWNTGLSPSAKPRATDEEKDTAIQVIQYLLFIEKIDFLVLGEISEDDILEFNKIQELKGYIITSGVSKSGKITFDTCFIYNLTKIDIANDIIDIDIGRSGRYLKVAQKLILTTAITRQPFYLFVSHWASRLWCQENDADRHLLGMRLRDEVDAILKDNSELIILLGDYNDEPFNESLARQLMATRDKALVKQKTNLLYNPFWKHLTYTDNNLNYAGTYFHKNGKETKWRTFDQIIISSAFITSELQLDEIKTGVVHIPDYLKLVTNKKTIFDHLPIKMTIERI